MLDLTSSMRCLALTCVVWAVLSPSRAHAQPGPDAEPLLAIDSLLSVENRGLTRLFVTLNDSRFTLVTEADEVAQSDNAFLIPRNGTITIDIADLLEPDDENPFDDDCTAPVPNGNNCIAFVSQGPDGASAQIVISDTPIKGQPIAYAITRTDLRPFPAEFTLKPGYPNPFTNEVTITYTVPEDRSNGVSVTFVIYDIAGQRVRTLVDAVRFPGTFRTAWDGRDGSGRPVASGVYFGQLRAGEWSQSVKLTRLR